MSSCFAIAALVCTAVSRRTSSITSSVLPVVDVILLSMIPVSDTPSKRSSSVFFFHTLRKYLKLVNVAWNVPRIVARRTFSLSVSTVSLSRTTTSDKLQNWYGRKIISLQGLHPKSWSVSRLPFLAACLIADCLLKIPRSPDLLSYRDNHSRMNVPISGLVLYATELLANARCPSFSHH